MNFITTHIFSGRIRLQHDASVANCVETGLWESWEQVLESKERLFSSLNIGVVVEDLGGHWDRPISCFSKPASI